MSNIGANTYEPKRGTPHGEGEPLSVVAFVADPTRLLLIWASVLKQTHRPIEFFIMNQARDFITKIEISAVRTRLINETVHPGIEINYMEGYDRIRAVRRAKHERLLLIDKESQFEAGHIESLLKTEQRTGKRAMAAYTVLGEHGGFDTAELVANKNSSAKDRLRFGMFLMTKKEISKTLGIIKKRKLSANFRLDAGFLEVYWNEFLSGRKSVGTKMPTQIVSAL